MKLYKAVRWLNKIITDSLFLFYRKLILQIKKYNINTEELLYLKHHHIKWLVFRGDMPLKRFSKGRKKETGRIIGGDWDKNIIDIQSVDVFNHFYERFASKIKLSESSYFKIKTERHGVPAKWFKYSMLDSTGSRNVARNHVLKFETLYQNIKTHGYTPNRNRDVAKKYDEICFRIGRRGDFLLEDGRHRLAIVLHEKIEPIPAMITWRHKEWIKYRNFFRSLSEEVKNELSVIYTHPDIEGLEQANDAKHTMYHFIKRKANTLKKLKILEIGSRVGQVSYLLSKSNTIHTLELRKGFYETLMKLNSLLDLNITCFNHEQWPFHFSLNYDCVIISDLEYLHNDSLIKRISVLLGALSTKNAFCVFQNDSDLHEIKKLLGQQDVKEVSGILNGNRVAVF